MRVVHAQAAHPRQAGDRAGGFPAVALPVFRQAQRQVAVAARPRCVDFVVVRAVHGLEHVALAHRLAARRLFDHLHRRVHALLVVREVARLREQIALGDVRRGDALVAGLELQLHRELLQLVADHRAGRQPQRQAAPDVVVQHEQVEFAPELLVVALLGELVGRDGGIEFGLAGERPSVDARHHHVVGIAPPVRPGDVAQLEGVAGDVAGGVHVRAFAHVQERAVAIEGKALEAVLRHQFGGVFALVRLLHGVQPRIGFGHRHLFPIEALPLLQDALHAAFEVREVGLGKGFAQDEVVVEAIVDGRAEAERGARAHLQHRLRQHVRQAVADAVERISLPAQAALFDVRLRFSVHRSLLQQKPRLADAFRGLRESGGLLGPPLIDQADATARQRVVMVVCPATFMGRTIGLHHADCNGRPTRRFPPATSQPRQLRGRCLVALYRPIALSCTGRTVQRDRHGKQSSNGRRRGSQNKAAPHLAGRAPRRCDHHRDQAGQTLRCGCSGVASVTRGTGPLGFARLGEWVLRGCGDVRPHYARRVAMIDISTLPPGGRVTVDSAPIIYFLEGHPHFAARFAPLFEGAEAGDYELVIATVTLAEVLTGPLRTGNEALAQRYRLALTARPAWCLTDLTASIAHRAARLRGAFKLRLPDAVQVATALETASIALVTHDRDFAALENRPEAVPVYG